MKITRNILGSDVEIELTEEEVTLAAMDSPFKFVSGALDKTKPSYKRWRAEEDSCYYFINIAGSLLEVVDEHRADDNYLHASGNYFKTQEEAENHQSKTLFIQKYKDRIRELNEGWVQAWSCTSQKYQLVFCSDVKEIEITSYSTEQYLESGYYFKSEAIGSQLIIEFTQEDLIKYLYN